MAVVLAGLSNEFDYLSNYPSTTTTPTTTTTATTITQYNRHRSDSAYPDSSSLNSWVNIEQKKVKNKKRKAKKKKRRTKKKVTIFLYLIYSFPFAFRICGNNSINNSKEINNAY